jgi:hypothetical protein
MRQDGVEHQLLLQVQQDVMVRKLQHIRLLLLRQWEFLFFTLGSSSFRCLGAGTVTYTATATNSTGITYSLDGASLLGGNTINSSTGAVTYSLLWIGTSTITATATGCNGPKTATHTVTINASVSTPSFISGSTSNRCQATGTVTYTAIAANTSGITYSLDAASIAGGNSINSSTGDVTYAAGWAGTSMITASAAGCNGPKTATHTVTTNAPVTTPVFTLGASSTRCQAAGSVTYTATASNTTGITYSLDATSGAVNSINPSTGTVTYVAGWSGVSTITASAAGCNGPKTATHSVYYQCTSNYTSLYIRCKFYTLSGSRNCKLYCYFSKYFRYYL